MSKRPIKISLIMATVDRYEPVLRFITSLSKQNCNQAQIELIVIDQNSDGRLSTYLESVRYEFDILYVSTPIRGLSKARNIGLKMARGTFVGFPDDDCEYYPDTISQILAAFQNGQQDLVVGRIFDRQLGKTVLKNFPKKSKRLTLFNCHAVASSIVIFERKSDTPRLFNESMGAGEYFGSCEDLNYLFEGLRAGLTGIYLTQIEVWHPESDSNFIPLEKVGSYSRGFGYFVFQR